MIQDIAFSEKKELDAALEDVYLQLPKGNMYGAIIFYASTIYDFEILSKKLKEHFSKAELIGTTTAGEISSKGGFSSNSLVVCGLYDNRTRFAGILIDGADKFPIVHKKKIEEAARNCGILLQSKGANKDAFAITFINGLCNAEESVLSLINSIIGDDDFMIAGGSAGDDCHFSKTYVCYNGEIASDGAAVLFVKTACKFQIVKENIFKPSGKKAVLTGVIPETRTITSIDGKNAKKRYAEILGIHESSAEDATIQHPLGRVYGGHVFLSSLASFNKDGSVVMYSRVIKDSVVEIMEPVDEIAETEQTCKAVMEKISKPGCVLFVNCIYRTIQFNQKHLFDKVADVWKNYFGKFCGFSSYGEQIGKQNSNQTLVAVVIEE